ncbi:MAG: hypothetical protein H6Q92_842 [Nitrospirae bacterium]|nr:hypothetical protein [Nitrospirota bacterium]
MKKLNCWEFKKCGRQFGGEKVSELGLCPVVIEISLEGTHDGESGGRACWVLEGTICKGYIHGNFIEKQRECEKCDFYEYVKQQEGNNFLSIATLLKIIEDYNNREL